MDEPKQVMIEALSPHVSRVMRSAAAGNKEMTGVVFLNEQQSIHNVDQYLISWGIAYLTSTSQSGRDDAKGRIYQAVEALDRRMERDKK